MNVYKMATVIVWENRSVRVNKLYFKHVTMYFFVIFKGKKFKFYNSLFRPYFTTFHAFQAWLKTNGLPLVNLPDSRTSPQMQDFSGTFRRLTSVN